MHPPGPQSETKPTSTGVQASAPLTVLYVPIRQGWHCSVETLKKLPTGQGVQTKPLLLAATRTSPLAQWQLSKLAEPAAEAEEEGQEMQEVRSTLENVLVPHSLQATAPEDAVNQPGAQGWQRPVVRFIAVPALQGTHSVKFTLL